VFEGTADDFETTLQTTDPTVGDQVYALPNNAAAATYSIMFSTLGTNALGVANSVWGGTSQVIFEGAVANDFETTISLTEPTVDNDITRAG
jgi:hypothetical protein